MFSIPSLFMVLPTVVYCRWECQLMSRNTLFTDKESIIQKLYGRKNGPKRKHFNRPPISFAEIFYDLDVFTVHKPLSLKYRRKLPLIFSKEKTKRTSPYRRTTTIRVCDVSAYTYRDVSWTFQSTWSTVIVNNKCRVL